MATVRYLVNDVDVSIAFYSALGFEVAERMGPPFAIVKLGDLKLWLSGPASSAARALPDGSKPVPGGWNRLVIEVADIKAAVAEVKAKEGRFRSEPIEGPGGWQAVCEDPSGNPIELFQPRR